MFLQLNYTDQTSSRPTMAAYSYRIYLILAVTAA